MKQWQTKAEAEALDACMTLVIQYVSGASADDLSIDTMGVRSVERVIDLLKEYGLVETLKLSLGERMIGHVTEDRINNERWRELDRYRASEEPRMRECRKCGKLWIGEVVCRRGGLCEE